MTDNNHPITPSRELIQQWLDEWMTNVLPGTAPQYIAAQAARWGADQELEACCEWLETGPYDFSIEATAPSMTKRLRAARRPKPPSLKEKALEAAQRFYANGHDDCSDKEIKDDFDTICRALEALPDD